MMNTTAVANKTAQSLLVKLAAFQEESLYSSAKIKKFIQLDHFILNFLAVIWGITFCKRKNSLCVVQYFTDVFQILMLDLQLRFLLTVSTNLPFSLQFAVCYLHLKRKIRINRLIKLGNQLMNFPS